MDLTTFIILVVIYLIAIVISMFIEDVTYKKYYFIIIALGTLCFLNIYTTMYYYISLRNDPGIPGPRGAKGDMGPSGKKGRCVMNDTCSFTPADADKILYDMAASKFETSKDCLKSPSLKTCAGGASEVERVKPVNIQIKMLEEIAGQGIYTKDEFETKIKNSLGSI